MRRRARYRSLALSLMLSASMAIVSGALASPGYVEHLSIPEVFSVAFNSNTNRYYLGSYDYIVEIDASTNRELSRLRLDFDTGVESHGMTLNAVTNKLYISKTPYYQQDPRTDLDYVQVIDLSRMVVLKQIQVGAGVAKIGINSVTNRIYVANYHSGTVSVIDGSTDEVMVTIDPNPEWGSAPYDVAVNERTNTTYLSSNGGGGAVYSIDGATNQVTGMVLLNGGSEFKLAVNPETNRLYVGDGGRQFVHVLDASTLQIMRKMALGEDRIVMAIEMDTSRNMIYVALSTLMSTQSPLGGKLVAIDGMTNQVKDDTLGLADLQSDMAINEAAHMIYLAQGGTLSVISEDLTAPVVTVVQQHGDLLRPGEKIRGSVTDDFAGVEDVQISYTSATGSGTLTVDLVCDQPRLSCSFSAWPPAGPQVLVVNVTSTDRFANATKPQQIALLKGI